ELVVALRVTDPLGLSDMAIFSVSIVTSPPAQTPVEALEDLIEDVHALVANGTMPRNGSNGLLNPLQNALKNMNRGNLNPVCGLVHAFINGVDKLAGKPLSSQQAAELIGAAA